MGRNGETETKRSGEKGSFEIRKLGRWEKRKEISNDKGEKGSFENRKLGRWENLCNLCSIFVIEDFWGIQKSQN